jgi:hypothetical protein
MMDKWSAARFTGYAIAALAGLGWLLHAMGLAVYDATTQTIDMRPFSIVWLGGLIGPVAASVVAPVAIWMGWGKKE